MAIESETAEVDVSETAADESGTAAAPEEWVDVRMTEPGAGEWDLDLVVVGGRVEYADLRVRPDLVASFVECLVADVSDERASEVLATVARRQGIDPDDLAGVAGDDSQDELAEPEGEDAKAGSDDAESADDERREHMLDA